MTTGGALNVRVLLTGANGLIGSVVAARLMAEAHEVTGVGRRAATAPAMPWIRLDLRNMAGAEDWLPHLKGIDAVVNCAGVLQDSSTDSTQAAHATAPAALFAACGQAGVRRVIHLSAIEMDRETPSAFSRSKAIGDKG
jgi:uncharacterized protein YbjT (DUF2867 family)